MKILLTGMHNRQLADIADELRAEFPEAKFEVMGNDEGEQRRLNAVNSADVVVSGRFTRHVLRARTKARGIPMLYVDGGPTQFAQRVREFFARARR